MKKRTILLSILMVLMVSTVFGQNDYPVKISKNTTQTIHSILQDLWVITDLQMDSVISTGLANRTCDSLILLYKEKIDKLESKTIELQAISDTLQKGYYHYVEKWNACDKNLETTEKKLAKQKRLKYIFGGSGLAIGLVLAILIL